MLDVRDITVAFGDGAPVLDGASLTVGNGEVVALLGPSGSGKSTLLRVIAGLIDPSTGSIHLDGRDVTNVPTHRRGVGMVFQDDQLFPHLDVEANIEFGLRMQPRADRPAAADRHRRVAELLTLVGLDGFGGRHVTELSGGEAKRVALARSLAPRPGALLLDEPLTGLDRELHDRLAVELVRILRDAATTTLIVTHDVDEATTIADRVMLMSDLTDRVVEVAPEATHPLRRRLLRTGTPGRDVVWAGDDDPATIHLGLRDRNGELIGVSTWVARPFPCDADRVDGRFAVQLRGMAVEPARQGRGAGRVLLRHGVDRAFADGADEVWANARDTALAFYQRHGFEVVGEGFLTEDTALPHHRIRLRRPDPPG